MNAYKLKAIADILEKVKAIQGSRFKSKLDESRMPQEEQAGIEDPVEGMDEMSEGKPKGIAIEKVEIMGKPKGEMGEEMEDSSLEPTDEELEELERLLAK